MEAFVKFLLDYYVWILTVLGISIVTVIGFLVDSRKKRLKKEKNENKNLDNEKDTVTVPESNVNDMVPVVDAVNQTFPTTVDNVIGGDGTYINQPTSSQIVQPQNVAVTNAQNLVSNTQGGLALSEQKPHFETKEVNIPIAPQNATPVLNNQFAAPQPVNAVSINQPVNNQVASTQQPINNQMLQPNMNYQSVSTVAPIAPISNVSYAEVQGNQTLGQNIAGYSAQTVQPQNIQQQVVSNQTRAQVVQPTVNEIPTVQPVYQQPLSGVQNTSVGSEQQVSATPDVGMNFITGEHNLSDSNDMWKL